VSDPISLRTRPYADSELEPGYRVVEQTLRLRERRRPSLHVLLFAATFVTAALAYTLNFSDANPFTDLGSIAIGVPYALALLSILLAHEFGHYALARVHGVDATLPFFIPAPPLFFIGTLGAFIRMRSMPRDRDARPRTGGGHRGRGAAAGPRPGAVGSETRDAEHRR